MIFAKHSLNILKVILLTAFVFCGTFFWAPKSADASLTISPLRIVLEGRNRSAEVMLLNLSKQTNTYRLGWIYNKMDESGHYTKIKETLSPEMDVAKYVVFSPRQVSIPPSGRQKIRLSLRRPPELPDGEYRAHLVFQKLPGENSKASAPDDPKRGVSLNMEVLVGFSIPVIVRIGEYDSSAEITNPHFISAAQSKTGKPQIGMTLKRTGKYSTLGKITIHWDGSDKPDGRIGLLNNVSIFPEMKERAVNVHLNVGAIPGGNITIRYEAEGPQRGITYAERTFPVGQ